MSGIEESSDKEQEENIALVGLGKNNLGGGDEQEESDSDNDDNCLVEDSDDDGKPNFLEFKETLMNKPQLVEGMKFSNVKVFRKLLREYHIKEGYTFKFVKNKSKRVTVVCARNCGFRLHASPMYEERSFQIKKINRQHECIRVYTNNNATSSWLSQKYLTKLSDAPETKGFLAGCKPIIGLDACFLKGPFGETEEIAEIDQSAYDWLMREEPRTWARCMYGTRSKYNRMDNNTSEAFNDAIKEARDQPILTMLETIRRKWDVCGIPCAHGMAAIITDKSDPDEYVDKCFHASMFAKSYSHIIKPIPDQTMWVHIEFDPISPPLRKKSGRPKKSRRRGQDEPKNPKRGVRKHYTTLKGRGSVTARGRGNGTTRGSSTPVVVGGRGEGRGGTRGGARQITSGGRVVPRGGATSEARGGPRGANTAPVGGGKGQGRGQGTGQARGGGRGGERGQGRGANTAPVVGGRGETIGIRGRGIGSATAMWMNQQAGSSAASCGSGSATGSATIPGTSTLRQYSQRETSTPSTQKSTTDLPPP
ncbi:hypothetical protein Vadar_026018 [Vaccinium darrowii]|uniref:Uncharacterized protein n=1 Tax=Vaccinium darrowii TaxID=229202 RepID=A0ACB7YQ37_9ERIC|nr:hypothetical protein Vadar_026018 [Vaccinium darrowii]